VATKSYEAVDIKHSLAEGGKILGIFIVSRRTADGVGHVAYFRTDFGRGFLPFRSFRGKSDRVYKSVDSLLGLIRDDFGYMGEISIFLAGDKALRRFKTLLPAERSALAQEDGPTSLGPTDNNAGRAAEPGQFSWDNQPD
jgi:hypothetical protein